MDLSTSVLLGVVGLLAVNQLLVRVAELAAIRWLFYVVQLANLAVGTLVLALGLPGFEEMRAVTWFIGLMFFWRVIQNNRLRVERLEGEMAEERRREAVRGESSPPGA